MTNKEKIKKIDDILYKHQYDALIETDKNNKGIVILPTGAGKTFLEAAIIARDILLNDGFRIYVVNAPRIMLSYQLLLEIYKFLTDFNIEARYMGVHSGRNVDISDLEKIREDSDIPFAEINSSTSSLEINKMIRKSKRQKLPLIMFSTYHSSDRIEEGRKGNRPIDIILNDEAHYLVQNNFHHIIKTVKHKKQFFFTATTKVTASEDGQGMNNLEQFGEVLYEMIPREAIDKGFMVRPRMHFVTTKSTINKENFDKNLGYIIQETFRQHQYVLNGVNPKMLISSGGSKDMDKFTVYKVNFLPKAYRAFKQICGIYDFVYECKGKIVRDVKRIKI